MGVNQSLGKWITGRANALCGRCQRQWGAPLPGPKEVEQDPHSWSGGCLLPKSTGGGGTKRNFAGELDKHPLSQDTKATVTQTGGRLGTMPWKQHSAPAVSLPQTHNPSWIRRKTSDRSQLRGAQQYLTSTPPHPQTVQVIKTKRSLRDCPRQEEPEET